MSRLSSYLVRLFARESVSLLAVMLGLLFLVQCLKIFQGTASMFQLHVNLAQLGRQ